MEKVDVGERLLLYRDSRNWSQERTAEEAGVSPTTITHIETGQSPNPRRVTLRRLARAFGVSLEEFESDRPPKRSGPSLPAEILRRETGHDHLTRSLADTIDEGERMSHDEIRERIREIVAESWVLHRAVREPSDHLPPEALGKQSKATREEIRTVSRGLVARVMVLAEIGGGKELIDEAERAVAEHQEANVSAA